MSSKPSASASLTSSTATTTDMPPPKKRKRSIAPEAPIRISAAPTAVALPPPLMPYHPHLVPSYYPMYHQHPYFLSVGTQPPISPSLSPTLHANPPASDTSGSLAPTSPSETTSTTPQRILPKSPQHQPTAAASPSALAPSFGYYPYSIQVSPQLHPTSTSAQHPGNVSPISYQPFGRHNSASSQSGTTADQREQARKVSHSAIERRRRERINDKIFQLRELIPSCSDRDNLHKMTILQSAIDYITYLKKVIEDLEGTSVDKETRSEKDQEFIAKVQSQKLQLHQQQSKSSMLPKEVEPFTHQFTITPPGSSNNTPTPFRINTSKEIETITEAEAIDVEEEEDVWSAPSPPSLQLTAKKTSVSPAVSLPSTSLKPMDIIKSSKNSGTTETNAKTTTPKVVVINSSQENSPTSSVDRNMNLENILC